MEFIEGAATVNNAAAVPIVVAIVQLFKMIGHEVLNKYAPFISVGVGILIAFLTNADQMAMHETILAGILYGLSASGLYSGTKHTAHTIKGVKENDNEEKGL